MWSAKDFFKKLRTNPDMNETPDDESGGKKPQTAMRKIEDFKRPAPVKNKTADKSDEEEILFPMEPESPDKSFSFVKFMAALLILGFVFFMGYASKEESLTMALEKLLNFAEVAIEKSEPVARKLTEFVDDKIARPEPAAPETTMESDQQRKIKYWQAPMNPAYTSDKPGKSPMGMDLVPVYESDKPGDGSVRISPGVEMNIGVKTEKVRKRSLTREIRTVGRLTHDERSVMHIHTKYEGWIEKLYVDFTGQEVEKGDLLIDIYSPELVSTQEEFLTALKYNQTLKGSPFAEIGKGAESLLQSTRRRLELFDVPEHQIRELIRDKTITRTMHIHSPVSGFVVEKKAQQGMHILPGMSLYAIVDLSNIWVLADVYEYELPWIRIGQKAEMSLSYFPGKKFRGEVTFIAPFLNPQTRTVKVRMEFENLDNQLKPDMYANVILKSAISKDSVAVPESAVIHSGDVNRVIVQNRDGSFEPRKITLGAQSGNYVQVLSGLRAGENVVTSSNFLIDSESKLNEAIQKLQTLPDNRRAKQEENPDAGMKKLER